MKRQSGEFPWGPHWENKMTSTRLCCPAVLAKTRVWVGCSVSRALKTWSWSFLWRDFRKYAICEFQKTTHFQSEAKCKTFVNWKMSFLCMTYTKSHFHVFHINSFAPLFWNRGLTAYPPIRSQKLLRDAFRLQFPSRFLSGELHYWSGFDAAR